MPEAEATRSVPSRRTAATTAAGLCYLAVIAGGLFAQIGVRESLVVAGDPMATTTAIFEHEALWRAGVAVHLFYLLPAMGVNVLVSGFIRERAPLLARLALVFGSAAVTVEAVSLVLLTLPLVMIDGGLVSDLVTRAESAESVYLATRLFANGFGFSLVLFAGFCLFIGVGLVRTRVVPRAIGAIMIVAGLCYLVNTAAMIVSPPLWKAINPGVLMPIFLGELSLAIWLLVRGVRLEGD